MRECDLILPVHNALSLATDTLETLLEHTPELREGRRWRLTIVDDASDARTATRLRRMVDQYPAIRLIRNDSNLGFVQSCILGEQISDAEFLLLCNSDILVPPGWLPRLLVCARSDPRIAAVNPCTNRASHIDVPIPAGSNYLAVDGLLRERRPAYPDVVTGVGFCLLLRTEAVRQLGFLDPAFGRGYCEDSDLCMRMTTGGWRTVLADDVYVHHHGSGSFGEGRERLYLANRRMFDARWGSEYRRQFAEFCRRKPLQELRASLAGPSRPDLLPLLWQTGRDMRDALRARSPSGLARAGWRGLRALPMARREIPDRRRVAVLTRPGSLRVTYVLDRMVVAGGVLSVIQIVNGLIRLGVDARIATLFEDPLVSRWMPLLTPPLVFRNAQELIEGFPESDIAVATLWTTADWVHAVRARGLARTGVYFLQDYEPWFLPAHKVREIERVRESFGLLEHRIVKSDWLAGRLREEGHDSHKIPLGLDLCRFYPRQMPPHPPTVLAMARPGTPRRGFDVLIAALERLRRSRPDLRIILFGDAGLRRMAIPFGFHDAGLVTDTDRLARLYSGADVFVDASDFQGFGRCGIEAMACGTACVLTSTGGVNEYARDGHNALLRPPRDPQALADAVLNLLDDPALRSRLAAAGLEKAGSFCHRREARDTLAYFQSLVQPPSRP